MIRLTVSLFSIALLALACGSGDSTSEGGTPPVSAQAEQAAAPPAPGNGAAAAPSEAPDPQALGCLDLVSKGSFERAIAPCTAAVRANPANTELKAALDKAQSGVADTAARAATDAAAQGAADAAADKMRY